MRQVNIEKILKNHGKSTKTMIKTDWNERFEDKITRKTVKIEKNFETRT